MECPITLRPLHELSHPVAFKSRLDQPYELHAVCDWLELSCTNPLTGQAASVCDLVAVGVGGDVAEMLLRQRSLTIVGNQVFRSEVKEIKDDLDRLNVNISELSKTISALVGEKTRLETRINFLNTQYVNNTKNDNAAPKYMCSIS